MRQAERRLVREKARLEKRLLDADGARKRMVDSIAALSARLAEKERPPVTEPSASTTAELEKAQQDNEFLRWISHALRVYGAEWLRLLSVGSREGGTVGEREAKRLGDVRLLVMDAEGLPTGVLLAGSCRIHLDRANGKAWLALEDVVRVLNRKRFPRQDEYRVDFEPPDPRAFELELQDWIHAQGEYPKPKADPVPKTSQLPEIALWKDRLSAFLDYAAGDGRFVLYRLAGIDRETFLGVEILGYTRKGVWKNRIVARRLEVWIDEDTDRVELRLLDGHLESSAGKSTFPKKRSYRLPLASVGGRKTQKLLMGMVRRFRSQPGADR